MRYKYKEPEFTEDDLVREHMGRRGEKPEDPSQPPPEGNTRPEFVYPPFVGWNTDNGIQNAKAVNRGARTTSGTSEIGWPRGGPSRKWRTFSAGMGRWMR